jgi:hypothetical protein
MITIRPTSHETRTYNMKAKFSNSSQYHTINSLPSCKTTPQAFTMPLWTIYHPPATFTSPSTRAALAEAITNLYTPAPMPAFYVNVLFQPIEADSFFIGAVARPSPHKATNEPGPSSQRPFIRITIQNIARKLYADIPLIIMLRCGVTEDGADHCI